MIDVESKIVCFVFVFLGYIELPALAVYNNQITHLGSHDKKQFSCGLRVKSSRYHASPGQPVGIFRNLCKPSCLLVKRESNRIFFIELWKLHETVHIKRLACQVLNKWG